ncbi:hypothetical protein [Mesorhizobium sp.]|uniref:hypothetical protein n=1 Tax=Mesorhizobium sp. TaxID=1871066 RepID=UPI001220EAB6|nr:hypothetical protein [Mesorhizobium sp.]TIO79436.1 MAG: hypothetical protein E5X75_02450 [Mesorhizobium sp.]
MIEPIKPGDDLFPYEIELIEGRERGRRKKDWNEHKQLALDLRTVEYLLQFPENIGHIGIIRMIEDYASKAMQIGDVHQRERFEELLCLRDFWIKGM